jgi:hypothetical protein
MNTISISRRKFAQLLGAGAVCADCVESKSGRINRMNYWEIIADRLSKAGWSYGCVATVDSDGLTIWIADAHRNDGKPTIAHQQKQIEAVTMDLQKVSAQLEASKPAPQVVNNNQLSL